MSDETRPRRLEQITAHLPGETIDKIWNLAGRSKVTKSEMMRQIIERGLASIESNPHNFRVIDISVKGNVTNG